MVAEQLQKVLDLNSLGAGMGASIPLSLARSLGGLWHGQHGKCGVSIACELSVTHYACQPLRGPMSLALRFTQCPQTCQLSQF